MLSTSGESIILGRSSELRVGFIPSVSGINIIKAVPKIRSPIPVMKGSQRDRNIRKAATVGPVISATRPPMPPNKNTVDLQDDQQGMESGTEYLIPVLV